jgi:hypothetical protein
MISFTHITYSVWVPNDGFPGFDVCLRLVPPSYLGSHSCMFIIVSFFLNWRTSFQRERILEVHSHRFVVDFGNKAQDRRTKFDDLLSYSMFERGFSTMSAERSGVPMT